MRKVVIENIGTILLKRSSKARNLCMSPFSADIFKIAVPYWVSLKKAEELILKDIRWIKNFSDKIKEEKAEFDKIVSFVGKNNKTYNEIELRVKKLAELHGYQYKTVLIKVYRTQWGSCTLSGNIKLNGKIIYLPDALIDYVILHELVHTRIRGHKKDFWNELDKLLGNAKKIDKKLKKFRLEFL